MKPHEWAFAAILVVLLPVMGHMSKQGDELYAKRKEQALNDRAPLEKYTLTGAANLKLGSYVTGGKYSRTVEYWEGFDTATHYVANPAELGRLCPGAFDYSMTVNQAEQELAPAVVDKYVELMDDKTMTLMGRALRTDGVSPAMANCPWLAWDKETKAVHFHGKPVVLFSRMLNDQLPGQVSGVPVPMAVH